MDLYKNFSNSFWSEDFWLPQNVTWKHFENGVNADLKFTTAGQLLLKIPLSLCILLIRYVVERLLVAPIGKYLGVRSTKPKLPIPNKALEEAYSKPAEMDHEMISSLAKQCNLTERQIQRWFRQRKAQDKPTTLVKFRENGWGFIYYTVSFIFGTVLLWDKPWLFDTKQLWVNYPYHSISDGVWWYCMISMSFYLSLTFSQFFDVKRKDFWEMFIHHLLTIIIGSIAWICNLHRLGSLILYVHDLAAVLLDLGKCLKYANYQKACDTVFVIFTVVWVVSRLGMLPRVIYSLFVEMPQILSMYPVIYVMGSLLIMLVILHLMWTYMIFRALCQCVKVGKIKGDVRSSSEDEISENRPDVAPEIDFYQSTP